MLNNRDQPQTFETLDLILKYQGVSLLGLLFNQRQQTMAQQFRVSPRHALCQPLPVTLYNSDAKVEEGMLLDASDEGMGILVTTPRRPAEHCTVSIFDEEITKSFEGVISYVAKTEYGLRLGVHLTPGNENVVDYLEQIYVEMT
ncbi:hypothetical protein PVT67_13050 [Gallaecimonas kandeliae]|uniref:PilZ domain-containing protein n=1 Tax=Gallaecimonas kandeliae TaxID=3029055 RepID=UPI0026489235|nr:PilZ domain-containing protein [Gallaecimonas kandeliae]WKE64590.1 hypothetical protein PVT67_13050 [Gallaecimonas kandeliae]